MSFFQGLTDNEIKAVEDDLPESIKEIAGIIGIENALELVSEFGGVEIFFPAGGNSTFSRVVDLIGKENAEKLHFNYREVEVYIPCCSKAIRKLRNRVICTEYDELLKTMSAKVAARTLARKYFMSNRGIEKIVNGKDW